MSGAEVRTVATVVLILMSSLPSIARGASACERDVATCQSVYKVRVHCRGPGEVLVQTGFRVQSLLPGGKAVKGILTSLHGVSECTDQSTIDAIRADEKVWVKSLKIVLVDVDSDVAVLDSQELSTNKEGFESAPARILEEKESVKVWGYPRGVERFDRSFVVDSPPLRVLREVASDLFRGVLEQRRSPHPGNDVLVIIGNAAPGSSGGPVLANGKVVGLLAGGVGELNLSWVIPIERVNLELRSKPAISKRLSELLTLNLGDDVRRSLFAGEYLDDSEFDVCKEDNPPICCLFESKCDRK